jgi:hypothetical protein
MGNDKKLTIDSIIRKILLFISFFLHLIYLSIVVVIYFLMFCAAVYFFNDNNFTNIWCYFFSFILMLLGYSIYKGSKDDFENGDMMFMRNLLKNDTDINGYVTLFLFVLLFLVYLILWKYFDALENINYLTKNWTDIFRRFRIDFMVLSYIFGIIISILHNKK